MKKALLSIIVAASIPFSVAFAGEGPRHPHKQFDEKFAQELNLSAEQQAKIKEIREKHNNSRKAERAEIKAVLTPAQQTKMEALKKDHPRPPKGENPPAKPDVKVE